MEKITLNNLEDLDKLKEEGFLVESLDDLIKRKEVKESLTDAGITRFKEIKNINSISFGHFILLEKILDLDKIDADAKIKMIAPILLRPLNEVKLDNEDTERENKHKENVFTEPIGNIYGAFNRFMDIRKTYLYKTYNGVIYGVLNEDEDDEEEEGTSLNSSQSARGFHTKRFFWNSMISDLANGDIFKFDEVVELMMYVVMPYLAEKRSLQIVENLELKASRV